MFVVWMEEADAHFYADATHPLTYINSHVLESLHMGDRVCKKGFWGLLHMKKHTIGEISIY